MDRKEFLKRLEKGLATLPYGERESALRYYEEYFDDAGRDNEQRVINELGSPEALAKVIIAQSELGETIRDNRDQPAQEGNDAIFGRFSSLHIDVLNAKIVIQRGTQQIINLDYPEDVDLPKCEVRGDTLHIIEEKRGKFHWFGGWNNAWRPCSIYITLTDMQYEKFDISTVNGGIDVAEQRVREFKAESVNGSVTASKLNCGSISLSNVNGSVNADSCTATQSFNGSTVNGSLKMQGEMQGRIKADTVNGSVRLDVNGAQRDYDLKLSTVSGSVRVNGVKQSKSTTIMVGGGNVINASTVNGSVNIDFER